MDRVRQLPDGLQMARAIACFLLVIFHVIGGNPDDGLRLPPGSQAHDILAFLSPMRMPLFAMLSGVVYTFRPVASGAGVSFLTGKTRRILLPFLTVSTLFFAVQVVTGADSLAASDYGIPMIYLESYSIFWFLQAIFLVFVFIALFDRFLSDRVFLTALTIVLLIAANHYTSDLKFFSLWGAIYLLPYFLVGTLVARHQDRVPSITVLLVGFAACAILYGYYIWYALSDDAVSQFARAGMGVFGGVAIIKVARSGSVLDRIGTDSFPIYLFHIFFIVAARMACNLLDLGIAAQFVSGAILGISGPILIARVIRTMPLLATILLGERQRTAPRPAFSEARIADRNAP